MEILEFQFLQHGRSFCKNVFLERTLKWLCLWNAQDPCPKNST